MLAYSKVYYNGNIPEIKSFILNNLNNGSEVELIPDSEKNLILLSYDYNKQDKLISLEGQDVESSKITKVSK